MRAVLEALLRVHEAADYKALRSAGGPVEWARRMTPRIVVDSTDVARALLDAAEAMEQDGRIDAKEFIAAATRILFLRYGGTLDAREARLAQELERKPRAMKNAETATTWVMAAEGVWTEAQVRAAVRSARSRKRR